MQCAWLARKAAEVGRGRGEGGEEVRREEDRAQEAEKIFLRRQVCSNIGQFWIFVSLQLLLYF